MGATSLDKAYVQRYLKLIEPMREENGASEDEEVSDTLPTESDESDSDSSSEKNSCTSFTSNLYDCPMTHPLANHHPKRTRDDMDVHSSPNGDSDSSDTESGSESDSDRSGGPTSKRRRL